MKVLAYLRCFLGKFLRRSALDQDIQDEIRSHIQHRADDLERSGLNRAEALRRARVEFGGNVRFTEECREALGANFIETTIQDVRFSFRTLRKSPGFTAVSVLTLTLGIGANAVVFGVLNGFVLRPLNVPQAESLYGIEHGTDDTSNQSYPDYLDLRARNRSFDDLAAYNPALAGLDTGENPSRTWLYEVSGNYFDVLGIRPYLGRFFHASDEHGPNSAPYVVLAYAFWHSHFQHDRGVVGRTVQVNRHSYTILGVAPPEFHGTLLFFSPDLFVPLVNQEQVDGEYLLEARSRRVIFMVLGHLKPGVTQAQAVADLNSIGSYLENTYPKDDGKMSFRLARPSLYGDYLGRPVRAFVTALMVLAGLVLLAACANLGGLFAARAADRSREVALRLALGSGRVRILRQLFTEAMLISLTGGVAGILSSVVLLKKLSLWQPFPQFPLNVPVSPDASVYLVAALLAIASGLLFGAVPVRQVLRTDPYEIIKSAATGRAGMRITLKDLLLVVQISICAVLVSSSIVAVRGLARSLNSDFGFQPRNALLVDTVLDMAGYRGDAAPVMQKRMLEAMGKIPGVTSAGMVDWPPLSNGGSHASDVFTDETVDLRPANSAFESVRYGISPGYLDAASTTLLAGRDLSWHDDQSSTPVALVNREFADRMFGPATNAMGKYFKLRDGARFQVVGIVENGKYQNLTEDQQPAIFLPLLQSPSSETSLVVRSNRDPWQLTADIQRTMRGLDSGLPFRVQTWNEKMNLALFPSRVATAALGILGAMAAMLSITGIFGMAAYSVSRRRRELGIRMALGAQRKEVLRTALGRAFKLLAIGSIAGLSLGILSTRVLALLVYQANPRDPIVLGGVILAMSILGLLATWIPAQRALSLDPLKLLREE